eukprot:907146_1
MKTNQEPPLFPWEIAKVKRYNWMKVFPWPFFSVKTPCENFGRQNNPTFDATNVQESSDSPSSEAGTEKKSTAEEHPKKKRKQHASGSTIRRRQCSFCGNFRTPLWRSGPQGPKSLCNACAMYLLRHGNLNSRDPDWWKEKMCTVE